MLHTLGWSVVLRHVEFIWFAADVCLCHRDRELVLNHDAVGYCVFDALP